MKAPYPTLSIRSCETNPILRKIGEIKDSLVNKYHRTLDKIGENAYPRDLCVPFLLMKSGTFVTVKSHVFRKMQNRGRGFGKVLLEGFVAESLDLEIESGNYKKKLSFQ